MGKQETRWTIATLCLALGWLVSAAEADEPASVSATEAAPSSWTFKLFSLEIEATVQSNRPSVSSEPSAETGSEIAVEAPWYFLYDARSDASTLALIGRADQNNRLNIFDNQSPLPGNRVWFSVRRLEQYKTGLRPPPAPFFIDQTSIRDALHRAGLSTGIIDRQQETLLRVAGEVRLGADTSLTVQGQYALMDSESGTDFFTNPQLLLKQVVFSKPGFVLSGLLGYQPYFGSSLLEYNDRCHSLTPGLLFLCQDECHQHAFVQGGFQFRIPLESNNVTTFDFVLSAGFWLWRHPSLDAVDTDGVGWGRRPWVLGLVPQVEVYGKHVVGDATITDPFGLGPLNVGSETTPAPFNPFVYEEPRHVYDVTVGAKLLLGEASVLAGGVSVPFTGSSVRNPEYVLTFSYNF
ncbi:MAG: hypothetical protein NZM31_10770 [Gemmatales bacterium]|nr:hypothetical protein [Gemmatales bacterium]MDW8387479.1 hypothetical protein [Gemmatales bacterium]